MGSEILVIFLFLDTTQQLTGDMRYVGPVIWSKLSEDVKTQNHFTALKRKFVR